MKLNDTSTLARTIKCPYCDAPVGEPCQFRDRQKRGYNALKKKYTHPHKDRIDTARAAQ